MKLIIGKYQARLLSYLVEEALDDVNLYFSEPNEWGPPSKNIKALEGLQEKLPDYGEK